MYHVISRKTPNVSAGTNVAIGLILHHTAGNAPGCVDWLCDPKSQASAHVVICKDGTRHELADDKEITWHAGRSAWPADGTALAGRSERNTVNGFCLGVEFEGDTNAAPLTPAQVLSFLEWLTPRWKAHRWTLDRITDHRTVAPGRKSDLAPAELARIQGAVRAALGG